MQIRKPYIYSFLFLIFSVIFFLFLFILSFYQHNEKKIIPISQCTVVDDNRMEAHIESMSKKDNYVDISGYLSNLPEYDYYNYGNNISSSGIYGQFYFAAVNDDMVSVFPTEIEIFEKRETIAFNSRFKKNDEQLLDKQIYYVFHKDPNGEQLLYGPYSFNL